MINSVLMAGRFLLVFFLLHFMGTSVFGQNYFVYIQSENKEPFYVKWQEKAVSSSSSGYVLLPKVQEGSHSLLIGFSSDSWLLKKYSFRIAGKDAGFLLKKKGENDWVLYNLQTAQTIDSDAGPGTDPLYARSDDAFVNILADVVEMPSLNRPEQNPETGDRSGVPINRDTGSKDLPVAVINKPLTGDTVARSKPAVQGIQIAENSKSGKKPSVVSGKKDVASPQKEKSSVVKSDSVKMNMKALSAGQDEGFVTDRKSASPYPVEPGKARAGEIRVVNNYLYKNERLMLFHVADGFQTDTVDVLMVYAGKQGRQKRKSEKKPAANTDSVIRMESGEVPVAKESKSSESAVDAVVQKDEAEKVFLIYCRDSATAAEFLKLRKRMAAENSEDAMLERAQKAFRSRCFTVSQVRNLSYLFIDEEKKLLFLESSYPCVADKAGFGALENLLTDPERIGRLRNLYRPQK